MAGLIITIKHDFILEFILYIQCICILIKSWRKDNLIMKSDYLFVYIVKMQGVA